jgi:hypothetical protein
MFSTFAILLLARLLALMSALLLAGCGVLSRKLRSESSFKS